MRGRPLRGRRTPSAQLDAYAARVAAAVRGGMTLEEAARHFGRTTGHICKLCRREGLTFGHEGECGVGRETRQRASAIAAAAARFTVRELAARFGVCTSTVYKACAERGARPRRNDHFLRASSLAGRRRLRRRARSILASIRNPRIRAIAELLLSTDVPMGEIAARCGTSRQWVQRVWKGMWTTAK